MNSASRNSIVRPSVFSEIRTNEKSNRNGLTRQSLNGTGKRDWDQPNAKIWVQVQLKLQWETSM